MTVLVGLFWLVLGIRGRKWSGIFLCGHKKRLGVSPRKTKKQGDEELALPREMGDLPTWLGSVNSSMPALLGNSGRPELPREMGDLPTWLGSVKPS